MNLDDRAFVEAADPHHVADVLAAFARHCREGARLAPAPPLPSTVKRPGLVVVAGMGGSAAGGDLVAACAAEQLPTPVLVHRGYGLPAAVGGDALLIASSYSGDTEEVLSATEAALARGVAVACVTAGGRLADLAARHGLPRVTVPGGLMPRMALGYLFLSTLRILETVELPLATSAEIAEAVDVLERRATFLVPDSPERDNEAKQLARAIDGTVPVIYGGPLTGAVAYRWKTDLEENAKAFAAAGTLPEMNHNEVEAWRVPDARRFHAVLLRDAAEPAPVAARFALLRDLISPVAAGVSEAWTEGRSHVARVLGLATLGQWTSYYVALLRGADPWPVPILDEFKRRLRGGPA